MPGAMQNSSLSTFMLIALMGLAFYFLIMRPQRKRQQAAQRTMSELEPGARVMLGSGLFGTVISVGEKQVVLEISPGAELTVLKQAIARVVTEADEDTEAGEEFDEESPAGDELDVDRAATEPEIAPHESPQDQPKDPRTGTTGIKE
jgi:preprotein translocase subunit YajC